MRKQIDLSQSIERLEYLADVIREAVEDDEPYTQDAALLERLREHWQKRYAEVRQV